MSLLRWQSLTTTDVRHLASQDPVIVLPVAAIEQHGPHLPLSTDVDIALGLIDSAGGHLPAGLPLAVLPPQLIGTSHEHIRFDGTLSLGPSELCEVIVALGASVARSGIRRLVVCNTHGGNLRAIDAAAVTLRDRLAQLVIKVSYFLAAPPDDVDLPEAEWRHGLHGGAVETAMMLHLCQTRVRTKEIRSTRSLGEELETSMRRVGPESPGASFAWLAGDLSATGVTGNAKLATADLGSRLVEHYSQLLADAIQDARDFPLERLV